MTGQDLRRIAWPQVRAGLLVVPLGSCEQHGPHLPFDVDTTVAAAVAEAFVARRDDAVLAPALAYGASGEHEGFAGTLSLGTRALITLIVELGRSASRWAAQLLLVNGHGGNTEAVAAATLHLRSEGRDVAWWSCGSPDGDAHAGRTETSLMLLLRPADVLLSEAAAGRVEALAGLLPELRRSGVTGVSGNGVLGDPAGASAAEGRQLLDAMVERLHAAARAWDVKDNGRLAA